MKLRPFENLHYKLLALLLAIATWLYVQGEQVVEGKIRVDVDWALPRGLVSTEPLPSGISARISGPRAAVRRAEEGDVRLTVDLAQASAGETVLEFASFPLSGLPVNAALVGYAPSGIRLTLDEVSSRKVAVKPVIIGEAAPGYAVKELLVEPAVVEIRGPRSVMSDLVEVPTKPVDLTAIAAPRTFPVELDLPRVLERVSAPPTLRVAVEATVERATFSGVSVVVPRHTSFLPAAPTARVTLEGPVDLLRGIRVQDLAVFLHLPDTPTRPTYDVPFGPESGVHLAVMRPHANAVKVVAVEPATITARQR